MISITLKRLQQHIFSIHSRSPLQRIFVARWKFILLLLGMLCLTDALCLLLLAGMGLVPIASAASEAARYTIIGKPSITATRINRILCQANSPACGTGSALYNLGVRYGVDPVFALAFFEKESTFGKYGVAATTHSLGNIRCTSDSTSCKQGYRCYRTWAEGYADWYRLIRNLYVNGWHLKTVPQIVRKYAPPSENDTNLYIADVEHYVDSWRKHRRLQFR